MELEVLYFGHVHGSCKTIDFKLNYTSTIATQMIGFSKWTSPFLKKKISERYPQKIKSEVSVGIFN